MVEKRSLSCEERLFRRSRITEGASERRDNGILLRRPQPFRFDAFGGVGDIMASKLVTGGISFEMEKTTGATYSWHRYCRTVPIIRSYIEGEFT